MVSADPLAAAVRVLQRQGSRTLAEVCRDVHSLMPPSRAAQFRARCALATMLHCNALSDPAERAAAFYALRASYDAANPACFPFLPLFLQAAGDHGRSDAERALLQALLKGGVAPLSDLHAATLAAPRSSDAAPLQSTQELREQYATDVNDDALLSGALAGARPATKPDLSIDAEAAAIAIAGAAPATYFRFDVASWQGARGEGGGTLATDEAAQAYVSGAPSATEEPPRYLRDLVAEAQTRALLPIQLQDVTAALAAAPHLAAQLCALEQLRDLVEHNHMLAAEVLLKMAASDSPQFPAYLESLTRMPDPSVHSMEVVKRLTAATPLPEGFLGRYINACIAACEATERKGAQNRPVRLVCVFLHSLVRAKIVNVAEVQFELRAFCLRFLRIKEALSLYRLLQHV